MHESAIAKELDRIWNKSSTRNWIPARLGRGEDGEEIEVVGRPGYVYVRMGEEGDGGVTIARDRVGVAAIGLQRVELRRELGELVIRAASAYAGGSGGGGGGSSTLAGLDDVALSGLANGHTLLYDSSVSKWKNVPPSGGGTTYLEGTAIDIDDTNHINVKIENGDPLSIGGTGGLTVKREALGAITLGASGGLEVNEGDGLFIVANTLRVKPYNGIQVDSNGVSVKPKITSGLVVDGDGLAVGAGQGIDVLANSLAVDVTDIIDTMFGLQESASNRIQLKIATTSGLTLDASGFLTMGAPSNLSVSSGNTLSGPNHAHAIISSSDVGLGGAAILASNAGGALTLAQLSIRGNLIFIGDREIQSTNDLTITPDNDLLLNPDGLILFDDAQEIRSYTHNDFVANIFGVRQWDTGGNLHQLNISKIKADELHVRVFSADENRVQRGATFWARSFGIVETSFQVPADEATVDVWFEEAADLGTYKLFLPNNWVQFRTIDQTTGLIVQTVWFLVVDGDGAGTNDYVAREAAVNGDVDSPSKVSRQLWRLRRKSGGFTNEWIKKGTVGVDFGKPYDDDLFGGYPDNEPATGQGVVHVSAIFEDGGPFVQIQTFDHVEADVPKFLNRTRMGNLNGVVGYSSEIYGFAAGNDLSKTPSTGFSGVTAEATGLRLYNTTVQLYEGSNLAVMLDNSNGINILQGGYETNRFRFITWRDDLDPLGNVVAFINSFDGTAAATRTLAIGANARTGASEHSVISLRAADDNTASQIVIDSNALIAVEADDVRLFAWNTFIGRNITGLATSTLQVYDNNANTGDAGGLTIEQDGTGDALLQFLTTAATRYRMGLDNDDGDKLKLGAGTHLGDNPIFATDNITFNLSRPTIISIGSTTAAPLRVLQTSTARTLELVGDATSSRLSLGLAGVNYLAHIAAYTGNYLQLAVNRDVTGVFSDTGRAAANINLQASSGDSHIAFYTSPTNNTTPAEAMRIDKNGRVGIGTATPVALQAGSRLTIEDSDSLPLYAAIINTGSGQAGLVLQRTGGTATSWISYIPSTTTHLSFYNSTLNNSAMTLTANGDVGIGIGVTPSATLHVRESSVSGADYTADEVVVVERNGHTHLNLISGTSNQGGVMFSDDVRAMGGVFYLHSTNALYLYVNAASRLHIDSSGWVGIGTSSPGAKLTVSNDLSQAIETIWMNSFGTNNAPVLTGRHSRGTLSAPTATGVGDLLLSLQGQGRYDSSNYHTATATIRFIAAENFTSVNRGSYIQFRTTPTGNGTTFIAFEILADGQLVASHPYNVPTTGSLRQMWINSVGVIGYNTSSGRFKRDLRPLPERLQDVFIKNLQPIVYKGKDDPDDDRYDQLGFIAESVEAAGGKELVSFGKDGQADTLFYERMIVPMVAVMQKLMARVDELERKLAAVN